MPKHNDNLQMFYKIGGSYKVDGIFVTPTPIDITDEEAVRSAKLNGYHDSLDKAMGSENKADVGAYNKDIDLSNCTRDELVDYAKFLGIETRGNQSEETLLSKIAEVQQNALDEKANS